MPVNPVEPQAPLQRCHRRLGRSVHPVRGTPAHIRSDNGPEFIAEALRQWLKEMKVQTAYIEPESPWENGYVESFNARRIDPTVLLK